MVIYKCFRNFKKILKVGQHYHVLTLLKPLEAITAKEMGAIRTKVQKNLEKINTVRSEVIFTEEKWY